MVKIRSAKLCFLSAIVVFLVLFSMLMFSVSASGNQEDAASSLSEAEGCMAQAYGAVLDAESADADVSGLLVRLNDAAKWLSWAHMSFDVGDFDDAAVYAESASELGYEVMDEAEVLETTAANTQVNNSWVLLIISVLAVSIVAVAIVVGYRYFKTRYYERLSKMKPKVE